MILYYQSKILYCLKLGSFGNFLVTVESSTLSHRGALLALIGPLVQPHVLLLIQVNHFNRLMDY